MTKPADTIWWSLPNMNEYNKVYKQKGGKMNFHTKAEVGDMIYFIYNNKIMSGIVTKMHVIFEGEEKTVFYDVNNPPWGDDEMLLEERVYLLPSEIIKEIK